MAAKPNYSYTQAALQQCPDLLAFQADPTLEKTFFVPSNDVSCCRHGVCCQC